MFRGRNAFFIATFVLNYCLALPYVIYNLKLTVTNDFVWIPHLLLAGFVAIILVGKLSRSKIDRKFFRNPVDTVWNIKLVEFKKLAEKDFVFDRKNLSNAEFYVTTVFALLPAIVGIPIVINFSKSVPWYAILLSFSFFIMLIIPAYWPAWKLYKAKAMIGDPKPYSYCFGYVANYARIKYYYKQDTSEIRNHSKAVSGMLFLISIGLAVDLLMGSQLLLMWINKNRTVNAGANLGMQLLEFMTWFKLTQDWLKYFYVDEVFQDIKKMPTP